MAKKQITNFKFAPGAIPPAYGQYPKTVALLKANRSFIIAEMDAYIRQQIAASQAPFTGYNYTTTRSNKCQRDVGYILDAIVYDLTYGGNSQIYQVASRFYLNGVLQIVTPTVELATYSWLLDKITTKILTNTTYTPVQVGVSQVTITGAAAETTGVTATSTEFGVVTNAIQTGLSTLPSPIAPNTQNAGLMPNTVKVLDDNKRFIQEETIAYIQYNVANNIAPYTYFTYDAAKCRRDISYILDAYLHDLASGGNKKTVNYVAKYFEGGVPQVDGSRQPEVYAHTFIRDLIENYILPGVKFSNRQTSVPQVLDNGIPVEEFSGVTISNLANTVIDVITYGLAVLPTAISNRGYVKFPGFYKQKDILLITNTTRNVILYNFSDPDTAAELVYSGDYDSDFPGALYGNDKITTIVFDVDTTGMMVTDQIQIFVEGKEQLVHLNNAASDAMERVKVGIPQSMLDADFEYGLQPTKWQTISMMRNYPSVYEIPGSDLPVVSVTTDASSGTGNIGSSLITVTTVTNHGFNAGDVFTIKALAASVKGFSRAEGTFLVASVSSPTVFTYYAKSRVGTTNPTTLSQTYTQLRKAGFYTGASVGTPSFNVYSNGQSGTVTTSLSTAVGSNIIGFTGSAPPAGAPITGTGIPTGSQITAVVGNGGTVTTTTLISTANIGDNTIQVTSTTGITPGLVIDRGDGTSVAVTDINSNTVSLSGALTSAIVGTNQTYTEVSQSSTSGAGTGATFAVSRLGSVYTATIGSSNGQGYVAGDTIQLSGASLGGSAPANNATITVVSANVLNVPQSLNDNALTPGTGGYVTATNIATVGGTGTGLTVDVTADLGGLVIAAVINTPGSGYTVGDILTINAGNGDATVTIATVSPGGDIISFTINGTPVTAPSLNFISAFTFNDFVSSTIADASSISYTSIATIEVTFATAHGFIPGDSLTIQITSSGSNAQLAAGAYYVESVPTATTLRYTARAQGTIANTLTGVVYSRPDSYFVHRPYDGGVQLGTGGPAHGSTAIRMSKKYIRYQSGKGVMYNTGALFAPSYDIRSISSTGTAVGSTVTLVTDDTDHGCQVGAQIVLSGVSTTGYNGVYTVTAIIDERTLKFVATQALGSATPILGTPCSMAVYKWHGATVRSGTFDDQNGMFWQYDGIRMAVGKRSSTFQIAGTINIGANSNAVTGSNTRFTQQLAVGDRIVIKGMSHVVSSISSDTVMTVTPDYRGVNDVVGGRACKTIDLIIPQEQWNLDTLDGSGSSGYNIDVTKMQMIGMQWTWYGAGFIDFMLRGPNGDYTWAHRFRNSNVNSEAYMRSGNQPVRYEVINEGAKGRLVAAMDATQTTITMAPTDTYWFPSSGIVSIDGELIRFTGNDGVNLTGCTRAASMTQFVAGSNKTFTGSVAATHAAGAGVVLVSSTVTPIISHWGSAFMIDGQFDSDRGYLFNYASTGVTVSTAKTTAFLMRLAPSVSNAQTGDLGDRELLNRAQLLLQNVSITSDSGTTGGIVIEGILNPQNYPTDPSKIQWNGLATSAAGGQPSFAQVASGGSVTWSGNFSTSTSTVQGAFTTTLTAKSFAPSTNTLTATGFAAVTQTQASQSFGTLGQSVTALGFAANQPYAGSPYQSAISTARNDFLITNTQYDALTLVPQAGDAITGSNIAGGTTFVSATRSYNGTTYTRIVMSQNGSSTSTAGSGNNVPLTITSYYAKTYNSALSTTRNDFLITNTAYDTLLASTPIAVGDIVSASTYLTGGQTVTGFTRNYITIAGTGYTRITISAVANATSTAATTNGSQNINVTFTSSVAATYNSAISSSRSDFLITQSQYASFSGNLKVTDVLSATTYVTGGQTVSSITQNYTTINGTSYARIVMTSNGNATSTAGANPVTVTSTSAITATYGPALSTSRSDFLVTDTQWASSGILAGDGLSAATYITGSQTISSVTTAYVTIGGVSYTRVVMSAVANATSTSGSGNDVTVTVTAVGSAASYNKTNYLFFDSTTWASGGATIGTQVATSVTSFPAGTTVTQVTTRTYGSTTVYRVTFTQTSNTTINAAGTITWQFGAAYALPGEQVFSFISLPGSSDSLDLSGLKELTSTSIGGRGTFPNGPDVLAINVYKTSGSNTNANLIIRWGEAQA